MTVSSIKPNRVEVVTSVQCRRRWTLEQILDIVKLTNEPGKDLEVGSAKFLDGHARVSLFEEVNDLLIGKSGLFHSRYFPKLGNFVPSLWYGKEVAGQVERTG